MPDVPFNTRTRSMTSNQQNNTSDNPSERPLETSTQSSSSTSSSSQPQPSFSIAVATGTQPSSAQSMEHKQEPCSLFYEELRNEHQLSATDDCFCDVKVYRHAREPKHNSTSPSSRVNNDVDSSASSNNSISSLMRLLPSLPKWDKQSVCRTFLQRVSQVLLTSGVSQSEWTRILPLLVEDVSSAEWIKDNILIPKVNWSTACQLFTSHFQSSDYKVTLGREYQQCSQKQHEHVQNYSDRFLDLCNQLSIDDENDLAIQHFITHLHPSIQRQYHQAVAMIQLQNPSFSVTSLKSVIEMTVKIDVANRTSRLAEQQNQHPSSSDSNKHHHSSSSSTSAGKKCKHHPNATSHTTAECRSNNNGKKQDSDRKPGQNKSSSGKPQNSDSSQKKPVTCYACGQQGHLSNDPNCPKKKQQQQPTSSTAFSPKAPWQSSNSSSQSNNQQQ